MAPVMLPPSFYNSFWSPDYRSGLEVLFKNLEQGCLEDHDILAFVESQVKAHQALATSLLNPPLSSVSSQSTSSLQHTLLSLRGASSARGEAHQALAGELADRVLAGFRTWQDRHAGRVQAARDEFLSKSGVVSSWEKDVTKLKSLRQTYVTKSRAADDSEDDAKFSPAAHAIQSPNADTYTASPKPKSAILQRSGTVADRISEKLRAASVASSRSSTRSHLSIDGKTLPAPPTPLRSSSPVQIDENGPASPKEEKFTPPTDPMGQPKVQTDTPPVPNKHSSRSPSIDVPQTPLLLSGLSLPPQGLKDLLKRLDNYLQTTPAPGVEIDPDQHVSRIKAALASRQRSTILGTYEKTFSGEEVVEWLQSNVEGFGGDWERCADAAAELHRSGFISRAGVGRGFEPTSETHYVLKLTANETNPASNLVSPSVTNNFSMLKSYLPASMGNSDEPAHVRLRREAIKADEAYKEGVRVAEEKRLEMEERIERGLRIWERWERERLGAVRNVLKQYEAALARLPSRLGDLQQSTSLSVEAFNPEADLKALIEGNRTGPFRPKPLVYESLETDIPEVNFGIDLRKWYGDQGWKTLVRTPSRPRGAVPEVLEGLLEGLQQKYQELPDDDRRKAWLYEVPLHETHVLRNSINDIRLTGEQITEIAKRFNAPVIAGAIKLWLLELNPPVMGWEGWEDAKGVYPAIGADLERDASSAVTSVLNRLPGSHLFVLDAVIKHFRELIDSTKTEEANETYAHKLALSLGRNILRPQSDTDLTIGDRTPSLFLGDLISLYSQIFPSLVEKKKEEKERAMPVRKRTALVDQRISRSRMSGDINPQELLEAQHALANPRRAIEPIPEGRPIDQPQTAVSALGLGDPAKTEVNEPQSLATAPQASSPIELEQPPVLAPPVEQAQPQSQPRAEPQPPAAMRDPDGPPSFAEPDDSDNEGSFENDASATMQYLASVDNAPEDQPIAGAQVNSGVSGLRRAGSGETSRIRGPRGARGPRPGGARMPSQSGGP